MNESEIEILKQENSTQKAHIAYLTAQLNAQQAKLRRIYDSKSWRYTQAFRTLDGLLHNLILGATRFDAVPINELELENTPKGKFWASTGCDPQFLLSAYNPAVLRKPGWVVLEYHITCQEPLPQQLFIDFGLGFHEDVVLNHIAQASGKTSITFYVPPGINGLRLDPAGHATKFKLNGVKLRRLKATPQIQDPLNAGVNSYLQAIVDIDFNLEPVHQISRSLTDSSHWQSHGEDPFFLLSFKSNKALMPGWHRAKTKISIKQKKAVAKFYFDTSAGFNEQQTLALPFESGAIAERIIYCDKSIRQIRFDPIERKGGFRIEALNFEAVDAALALEQMYLRIASHHPEFAGLPVEAVPKQLGVLLDAAEPEKSSQASNLPSFEDYTFKIYNQTFNIRPEAIAYQDWIAQVEEAQLPTPEAVSEFLTQQTALPTLSIVMPVYNTPEKYLRLCIESIIAQSYPHWELCIADDKSPKAHVRKVLSEYAQKDTRIKVVYRQKNGHISRASNSALNIATGDFIALLDHDDALPEHALYFMAQAIKAHPGAQIIYSDEDKIDAQGKRSDPHFKSDWNPDLFYSQNYVSHLGVYKRNLLNQIGGFRIGVEGSQDQDLLLRCLPHVSNDQIVHIPRILYHWRMLEGSTAMASGEKNYTTDAGIKALSDYFAQHGPKGTKIEPGLVSNTYRIRWPINKPEPLVSLLIPTRDRKNITEVAIRSILDKTTYPNYEIIILDNGSTEPETLEWFEVIQSEDNRVSVLRYDHPFNYSAINNFGVEYAQGSVIGLINNDVEVISPDWLTEMVSNASREDIGCVGAKLYYSNDTLQHGGVILGLGGVAGHSHKLSSRNSPGYFARLILSQNLSAVTAACLIVRREIYEEVNGLDEENLKVAFNDVDFCLKVRQAGYRNLWTPFAELYHHESISRGTEDSPEKQARFASEVNFMKTKWGEALNTDPFYNPNLSKDREDFSIADNQ